jgi:predicted transcriptional regulator
MEKPDLYVIARFLEILYKSERSMKKTNIQTRLGLNYPRFIEYLGWFQARGLVQINSDEEGETVTLSEKGLESYHRLVDWIRETMGNVEI